VIRSAYVEREINVQTGSNGFAIAPSKTAAEMPFYTLIHTTFYFRPKYRLVVKKVCRLMVRLRGTILFTRV
jgi:hypothetical protein